MVWGLYIWSSWPLRALWTPVESRVSSTSSPRGSKARVWFLSTRASISFKPMPPTRETVPVKYWSITSLEMPMASKIWADW